MAIIPEKQYNGKIEPASAAYPYGGARNVTVPGDGTGTPWDAALLNDLFGWQQALLQTANVVPNENPETAQASQYFTALKKLFPRTFATAADMLSEGLLSGQNAITLGRNAVGDGGAGHYIGRTAAEFSGTPDEYGDLTLSDGSIAELMPVAGAINNLQYAADKTGAASSKANHEAMFAACKVKGALGVFRPGTFSGGFDNQTSDITLFADGAAIFTSVVHIAVQNAPSTEPKTSNVTVLGCLTTTDRVGTYHCKNILIDKIRQYSTSSRGVHIHYGTENLSINEILVEATDPAGDAEAQTAVTINGGTASGQTETKNVRIGRIVASPVLRTLHIRTNCHGVEIDSIVSNNAGGPDVWIEGGSLTNFDVNVRIGKLTSDGCASYNLYTDNVRNLHIDAIDSKNCTRSAISQTGVFEDSYIGKIRTRNIGTDAAWASTDRVPVRLIGTKNIHIGELDDDGCPFGMLHVSGPLGWSRIDRMISRNAGSNALFNTVDSFGLLKFGTVEIYTPAVSGVKFSGGVGPITGIHIDELLVDGAAVNNIELSTDVLDVRFGNVQSINAVQDNFYANGTGVVDFDFIVARLESRTPTRYNVFVQNGARPQIEKMYTSGGSQGLRAIDAPSLNIGGGEIRGATTGIALSGTNTGWLVNGLRVTGNTTNGALPADVVGSNIVDP